MFKVGDSVAHYKQGVCEVVAIGNINISCSDKDKQYYTLQPIYDAGGTLYTPVDNQRNQIREVTTKEEMNTLIEKMGDIPLVEVLSEKRREASYKEKLMQNKCEDWISILKTTYQRRKSRLAAGKKSINVDERYLAIAENFFNGEMAAALGITKEEARVITKQLMDALV